MVFSGPFPTVPIVSYGSGLCRGCCTEQNYPGKASGKDRNPFHAHLIPRESFSGLPRAVVVLPPQLCGMGTHLAGVLTLSHPPLPQVGAAWLCCWPVCCKVTHTSSLPFSCSPEADFMGRYCKMKINGTALGFASRCSAEGNNVVSGHQKELRDVQPESRDLLAGSQGRFD